MPRSDCPRRLPVLLLGVLGCATAFAAPPVLKAFGDHLAVLPQGQRVELQARAARWDGWSESERNAFRQRAAAWDALPPAERARRREQYAAWRRLDPAERSRLQAIAGRWQQLAPDQQQAWRARFDAQDQSAQRGWLLGPVLGADYPRLQPLLAQVAPAEQAPLLVVLRELTPVQRADLAVLVQRTPPQDRPALRRELVSTAAGQREAWLWQRLDR